MKDIIIKILAVIGGLSLILGFFQSLFTFLPTFNQAKSNFWKWVVGKWKYKKFKKAAIKSEIENIVNDVVFSLQEELPRNWIKRVSIEWVQPKDIEKTRESEQDEILLRIRPYEDQDYNILHGVYSFFDNALFPNTKNIIPSNVQKATTLLISRRTICRKKPFLKERFDGDIYEKIIEEDKSIINLYSKFSKIDNRGFFVSTFLREIHEIATRAQFEDIRNEMNKEINSILEHIQSFVVQIGDRELSKDENWYREGPLTSYAFLLVAQANADSKKSYIARAIERQTQGIERLYVLGGEGQKEFANYVISEIIKLPGYKLVEKFKLNSDFRAHVGGIGALFTTENYTIEK